MVPLYYGFIVDYASNFESNFYLEKLNQLDAGGYLELVVPGNSVALDISPYDTQYSPGIESQLIAARVSQSAGSSEMEVPALLLNCGVHAYEWIPQEVCLGYVDYLVKAANGLYPYMADKQKVMDILEKVEIWVVVQANPGGRILDEDFDGSGKSWEDQTNQRKNAQWEEGFDCMSSWQGHGLSGRCLGETSVWKGGSRNHWNKPGINVGRAFGTGWGQASPVGFTRNLIFGERNAPNVAPERYSCNNDDECEDEFPDHPFCIEYMDPKSGDPASGCFMAPSCDPSTNFMVGLEDEHGIVHSCLETDLPLGGGTIFLPWECGVKGDHVDDWSGSNPWFSSLVNEPLLEYCHYGVLVSCASDADCHPPNVAANTFEVYPLTDPQPPHAHLADIDDHLFCNLNESSDSYGHCSIAENRTCCSPEYEGQRPYESVEARMIRDLVNNVPFSLALDPHSSRSDSQYVCSKTGLGNGCSSGDHAHANGNGMLNALVQAYNYGYTNSGHDYSAGADGHWDVYYKGGMGLSGDEQLPEFITHRRKKSGSISSKGLGQLTAYYSSKTEAVQKAGAYTVTVQNFDRDTVRAIPSFLVELGTRKDEVEQDERMLYSRTIACDGETVGALGSRPRSRLAVENQLEGLKGMVAYLADQAGTPWNGRDGSGALVVPGVVDSSVMGLRIHDGHGRGVQQTEYDWQKVDDDPRAVTVIPAGNWVVELDIVSGGPDTYQSSAALNLWVDELGYNGNSLKFDKILGGNTYTLQTGTRQAVKSRYVFSPGSSNTDVHVLSAENSEVLSPNWNATKANDINVAKVRVVACDDSSAIPNGLGPDEFCQAGMPHPNEQFWCGGDGRCRECGLRDEEYVECEGPGAFCVDGYCDTAGECLSGQLEDSHEGSVGETSPVLAGWGQHSVGRTLHKKSSSGVLQQDVDHVKIKGTHQDFPHYKYNLKVTARDLCFDTSQSPGSWDIRIGRLLSGPVFENYETLMPWTQVPSQLVAPEFEVPLDYAATTAMKNGYPVRVSVRNDSSSPRSFSYQLEISLTVQNPEVAWPLWPEQIDRPAFEMGPSKWLQFEGGWVEIEPYRVAVETEQRVFFRPSEESERRLWQVEMVMVDRWGDVALDANGYPVGYAERLDGGLAIDTAGLEIDEGPFRVMVQSEGEPVGGRIYLCPPGAPDCSEHDVTRDICGGEGACEGEGEVCCLDANGAASCADTRNDIDNCGGCGRTCEWDEVCLDGVCARGEGISCWETECPDGTYCASDAWLFRTDPSCLALDVDRDNCGWKGHACGEGVRYHRSLP